MSSESLHLETKSNHDHPDTKTSNVDSAFSTESTFMDTIESKHKYFFDSIPFEDDPSKKFLSLLDQFEPPDPILTPPDDNILHIVNSTFTSSVILDSPDSNLTLEMTMDAVIYYKCFPMFDKPNQSFNIIADAD